MTSLKHASLADQDLSLLTERSVLLQNDWSAVCLYEGRLEDSVSVTLDGKYTTFPASHFTYLGEQSDDGWVKTPGDGWTENPVPGRRAFYRYRADGDPIETSQALPSDKQDWEWINDGYDDIIAFRLADQATREGDCSLADARTQSATGGAGVGGHTPGEWKFRQASGIVNATLSAGGSFLAIFKKPPSDADGRLIAAAPDLLEALKGMVAAFGDITITVDGVVQPETDPEIIAARAAIAKATTASAVGTTPKAECAQ